LVPWPLTFRNPNPSVDSEMTCWGTTQHVDHLDELRLAGFENTSNDDADHEIVCAYESTGGGTYGNSRFFPLL
jgi:hypothetical protein